MERNWGVSLLASILVYALVMAVVLVVVNQADRAGSVPRVAAAIADQQDDAEQDNDVGGGPPAWARANGKGRGHGADTAWKAAWQKLTPVQKDKEMAALVKAHEQGMKKWTDCVAGGGNDASKRGECVKPLPPGLAKKLP
jgi:hypothetical protein